jgi:DNA-binding MarR family transcriptional regulator
VKSSGSQPSEREVAQVMRHLRVLVAALGRSARRIEQRTGLTNAQLFILRQLADEERSINELAALALTKQSAVSLVVSRLERDRLVRRARSTTDARRVMVSLTVAGRRILRTAPEPPTARLLRTLHRLSRDEVRGLDVGLGALVHGMGADRVVPTMLFEAPAERTPSKRGGNTSR